VCPALVLVLLVVVWPGCSVRGWAGWVLVGCERASSAAADGGAGLWWRPCCGAVCLSLLCLAWPALLWPGLVWSGVVGCAGVLVRGGAGGPGGRGRVSSGGVGSGGAVWWCVPVAGSGVGVWRWWVLPVGLVVGSGVRGVGAGAGGFVCVFLCRGGGWPGGWSRGWVTRVGRGRGGVRTGKHTACAVW
jgi:hypothetical protein